MCSKSEGMNSSEECMTPRFLLLLCNHFKSWQVYDGLCFKIGSYFKSCVVYSSIKEYSKACMDVYSSKMYLFVQKSVC